MQYRHLGNSGLRISALSYGAWVTFGAQMDEDAATACMQAAWDAGVNFFDNAEAYAQGQAETMMGQVIKKLGWKRSGLVLSTKIFWGGSGPNDRGLSRKHILEGTEAALERLQVSYVDLLFCHRPDLHTPIEETVRAMSHLVDHGKALYWGTSEWSVAQISEAYQVARREHLVPPQMEQPEYNLFRRERVEREYAPLYHRIGLGTTTWSPLAGGLLTGKYSGGSPTGSRATLPDFQWLIDRYEGEEARRRINLVQELEPVATKIGCTLAQLAIAWCLRNPHVSTVITGASRPEQVKENMQALEVADRLTPEVLQRIEDILQNRPAEDYDWRG